MSKLRKRIWTFFCIGIMIAVSLLNSLVVFANQDPALPYRKRLPSSVYAGTWNAGHLQGMVIDDDGKYMYFSFTTMLVKTDMQGKVIGTVTGLTGHLGDLAYHDGKIYGSLEYKDKDAFYIAVFDADAIIAERMSSSDPNVMKMMYLAEVNTDYKDSLNAGEYKNIVSSMGHRYGCSGIDGIAFGKVPGKPMGSEIKLMVAYGIYENTARLDNDYQVILQYNLNTITQKINQDVLDRTHYHVKGPRHEAKYFVRTGNTSFGIQNLEYDQDTGDYWMAVYAGSKSSYPNYPLFGIDGKIPPKEGPIVGQHDASERGLLLTLKSNENASHDAKSGVSGYTDTGGNAYTGLISLGGNYFYISAIGKTSKGQYGYANLYKRDRSAGIFIRQNTNADEISQCVGSTSVNQKTPLKNNTDIAVNASNVKTKETVWLWWMGFSLLAACTAIMIVLKYAKRNKNYRK